MTLWICNVLTTLCYLDISIVKDSSFNKNGIKKTELYKVVLFFLSKMISDFKMVCFYKKLHNSGSFTIPIFPTFLH